MWRARAALLAPDAAGGRIPDMRTVLVAGAYVEMQDTNEIIGAGDEAFANTIRLTIRRTAATEAALRGTATQPAVEQVEFDDEKYSIRSYSRMYPNKIRLTCERIT